MSIAADSADACLFALRQVMRRTRAHLVLRRWMVEGFNRRDAPELGKAQVRNLLGFKDGTANLAPSDDELPARQRGGRERRRAPAWAVGGSYQVARTIRMLVEAWDRAALGEQEAIIGRHKATGAPLGAEHRRPTCPTTPPTPTARSSRSTPTSAWPTPARPRPTRTSSAPWFSYSRGFDGAGRLDQGLAFVSFQPELWTWVSLAVQERLSGEPLEEYIRAEGGGFFFAFPGVRDDGDFFGRARPEPVRPLDHPARPLSRAARRPRAGG